MNKIFNVRLLSFLSLIMFIGIATSCKKNKDENSGKIELLSFGPTGAMHGDTLIFIGRNLDKVTEIDFIGAAITSSAFITKTAELIKLIVPPAAEKGLVTLKTPEGDIVSKTIFNLKVVPSVTTITAQARPGENVTITGNYLNWVTRITFARDKTVATFVSKSINQIVVTIPLDAQTGPLILSYGGTDSADVQTKDTLKVTLPVATSFAPNPVKHQTNLTITGTNLDLARKIFFTGVSTAVTTFVSQTATQLVVKVPASTKKGNLIFEAASGVQTVSGTQLDVVLPSITTMSPNPVDPNANVTITGTDLDIVSSITFNNAAAVTTFISQSATQIVVKVPGPGVATGLVTLNVLNSTLSVQSSTPLQITGAAPPPTIAFPIYDDAVTTNWTNNSGWIGGGWGGTSDRNNGTPVRAGTKSVKIDYVGGWGSPFQLGGAAINTSAYTTFKISVYAPIGTGGKKINIGINGGDKYTITLDEGKWTDYAIPLSTLLGAANLNEIWVKEYNGTGGFTIYVDAIGLN